MIELKAPLKTCGCAADATADRLLVINKRGYRVFKAMNSATALLYGVTWNYLTDPSVEDVEVGDFIKFNDERYLIATHGDSDVYLVKILGRYCLMDSSGVRRYKRVLMFATMTLASFTCDRLNHNRDHGVTGTWFRGADVPDDMFCVVDTEG